MASIENTAFTSANAPQSRRVLGREKHRDQGVLVEEFITEFEGKEGITHG